MCAALAMAKQYGRNSWIRLGMILVLESVAWVSDLHHQSKSSAIERQQSSNPTFTTAELNEFDSFVLALDPNQFMVTAVTQREDSEIVDVTVSNSFALANRVQQGEIVISMRNALAKICECSPYLKFETRNEQRIVEIGRGKPKYKNLNHYRKG